MRPLLVLLFVGLPACDASSGDTDAASTADALDDSTEPDIAADTAADTADTGADTAVDTSADTAADTVADVATDTAADTVADVVTDTTADVATDTSADTTTDTADTDTGPTTTVCCRKVDGFELQPDDACAPPDRVTDAFCLPTEVCCTAADGVAIVRGACPGGAAPLAFDACTTDVCCDGATPGAFPALSDAVACPSAARLPMDRCDPPACCLLKGAYYSLPTSQCAPANRVAVDSCAAPEVCCQVGLYPTLKPRAQCLASAVLPSSSCAGSVCCKTSGPPALVSAGACPSKAVLPASACEAPKVCCDDGVENRLVAAATCAPGVTVTPDHCGDDAVCCRADNGYAVLPAAHCSAGATLPRDTCDQEVCCDVAGTPTLSLVTACTTDATLPMSACTTPPAPICCDTDEGPRALPAAQCAPGHELPGTSCSRDVCCADPAGPTIRVATDCRRDDVRPDADCAPPAMTCCGLDSGYAEVPTDQCHPLARLPLDECRREVCCDVFQLGVMSPRKMRLSECSLGVVPMDRCDPPPPPPDVCCRTDVGFVYLPVDACATPEADALCQTEVCCDTPTGPALTAAFACPFASGLALDDCLVAGGVACCADDLGPKLLAADQCAPTGMLALDDCTDDVCCTPDGGPAEVRPAYRCASADVAPTSACPPPEPLCCETGSGLAWVPGDQPCGASARPPELCRAEVCCFGPAGAHLVAATECATADRAAIEVCRPPDGVCCDAGAQLFFGGAPLDRARDMVAPDVCVPDAIVPTSDCLDTVCCETPAAPAVVIGGTVFDLSASPPTKSLMPAYRCDGYRGPVEACSPPFDVCCDDNGALAITSNLACPAAARHDMAACTAPVCCLSGGRVAVTRAVECPAAARISPDRCAPDDVCCDVGGTPLALPPDQCPVVDRQAPDACALRDVCCASDGGHEIVSSSQCPADRVDAMDECRRTVCCATADGRVLGEAYRCPLALQRPMSECREDVCCGNPWGDGYYWKVGPMSAYSSDATSYGTVRPAYLCVGEGRAGPASMCGPTGAACCGYGGDVHWGPSTSSYGVCGGALPMPDARCTEKVCCEGDDGLDTLTAVDCPIGQRRSMS